MAIMGDAYAELSVRRTMTPADLAYRLLCAVIGSVVMVLALHYAPRLGGVGALVYLAGAGVFYLCWRQIQAQKLEYRYTVTGGEIKVSKIIAKKKSAPVLSFHCRDIQELRPCRPGEDKPSELLITACSHQGDKNVWLCRAKASGQQVALIFNVNKPLLEAMMPHLPESVVQSTFHREESS